MSSLCLHTVIWFLFLKMPTLHTGEKILSSTKLCGEMEFPHQKTKMIFLSLTLHKNQLQMPQRSQCNTWNFKKKKKGIHNKTQSRGRALWVGPMVLSKEGKWDKGNFSFCKQRKHSCEEAAFRMRSHTSNRVNMVACRQTWCWRDTRQFNALHRQQEANCIIGHGLCIYETSKPASTVTHTRSHLQQKRTS